MEKHKNFSYEEYAKNNVKKLEETPLTDNLPYENLVKTLKEIMKLNKDAPIPETETAIEAAPSLDDLRSMMKDPRYWKDGERDQAYINKVSMMYEKYYGSQKAS